MSDMPSMPPAAGPSPVQALPPVPSTDRKKSQLFMFLSIGLGGLSLVLIVVCLAVFSSANTTKRNINAIKAAAQKDGAAAQEKADAAKILDAQENPLRDYVAPDIYGAFKIKIPKNWSLYTVDSEGSNVQLSLTFHPDQVLNKAGGDNNYAMTVQLLQTQFSQAAKTYQDIVKQKKMTAKDTVVSKIKASRFEGQLDQKHKGVVVLVPVRDKTLIFTNTDASYIKEFDQVLNTAEISP